MARISTYELDGVLQPGDKVIGTNAAGNNATMNFSLLQLGEFLSETGLAQSSVTFAFDVGPTYSGSISAVEPGHVYFNNVAYDALSEMVVSTRTNFNVQTKGLLNAIIGQTLAVTEVGKSEGFSYGFYNVSNDPVVDVVDASGNVIGYRIGIAIQAADTFEGDLPTDHVAITPLGAAGPAGPKGDDGDKGDTRELSKV